MSMMGPRIMDRVGKPRKSSFPVEQTAFNDASWSKIAAAASILAVVSSVGLQFADHLGPLIGKSVSAVSGASILAVSISFTGLAIFASYFQIRRFRQYEAALEEISDASDAILRGREIAARVAVFR